MDENGGQKQLKVSKLQSYDGVTLVPVDQADTGDIVVLAGIEEVKIGDTRNNFI